MKKRLSLLAVLGAALLVAACMGPQSPSSPQAGLPAKLAGTSWQLVEFQSTDQSIGVLAPADPSTYQMTLNADGTVSMKLDCNQASGTWTATALTADNGSLAFGPLAMTKAFCPPPSMSDQIARDSASVRSWTRQPDGTLSLEAMPDAGTYRWQPL